MIANICIPSKFYGGTFAPCTRSEVDKEMEKNGPQERLLLMASTYPHLIRRILNDMKQHSCKEACVP